MHALGVWGGVGHGSGGIAAVCGELLQAAVALSVVEAGVESADQCLATTHRPTSISGGKQQRSVITFRCCWQCQQQEG